jgi:chemotaxis protein histidine kinase CheA
MAKERPIELFMPPNMLKAKVGGTYAGLDMAAIKRADAAMEALQSEFADWAASDVDRLVAAREAFAKDANADTRNGLLRAAHDMKGQAATFNFPLIARVATSLCKLIEELKTPDALHIGLVDAHVSAVHVIYRDKITDLTNRTALVLTNELDARVSETLERAMSNPA